MIITETLPHINDKFMTSVSCQDYSPRLKGGLEYRKPAFGQRVKTIYSRARVPCAQVEHNRVIAVVTFFPY